MWVDLALTRTFCLLLDATWLFLHHPQDLSEHNLTFNKETSVTRPRGPANDASRTSVFAPLTWTRWGLHSSIWVDTNRVQSVYQRFPRYLFEYINIQSWFFTFRGILSWGHNCTDYKVEDNRPTTFLQHHMTHVTVLNRKLFLETPSLQHISPLVWDLENQLPENHENSLPTHVYQATLTKLINAHNVTEEIERLTSLLNNLANLYLISMSCIAILQIWYTLTILRESIFQILHQAWNKCYRQCFLRINSVISPITQSCDLGDDNLNTYRNLRDRHSIFNIQCPDGPRKRSATVLAMSTIDSTNIFSVVLLRRTSYGVVHLAVVGNGTCA